MEGPDLAAALGRFVPHSVPAAPFRFHARITPAENGVAVDGDGHLGGVALTARGVVDSLRNPEVLDLELAAKGADASEVGSWLGSKALPRREFELAGHFRRESGRLALDGVRARVGATTVEATGELGAPPRLVGTDLELRASGPDLTELASLARLGSPSGREVRARGPPAAARRRLRDRGGGASLPRHVGPRDGKARRAARLLRPESGGRSLRIRSRSPVEPGASSPPVRRVRARRQVPPPRRRLRDRKRRSPHPGSDDPGDRYGSERRRAS